MYLQQLRLALVPVSNVRQLAQQVFQVLVYVQLIPLGAQYQGVYDPVGMRSFRSIREQPLSASCREGPDGGLAPVVG